MMGLFGVVAKGVESLGGKVAVMACVGALLAGGASAAPIMHVHDSSGVLATVDVTTGTVSTIGNMGVVMTDIAFDPTGNLFGISFSNLYSINAVTGATTNIGAHGIASGNALVFGADGALYGAGAATTSLYAINALTGAGTSLGNMGFASGGDLAFNGGNLYLASDTNELIRINLGSVGDTVAVGDFGASSVYGLATGDNGVLYAVAGTAIYTVDTVTGSATIPVSFAGQGLGQAFGQAFYTESGAGVVTVPEPGAMALFGLALAGLAAGRRKFA